MFCPDCGSTVAEGRTFCGKCGARLNAKAGAAQAVAPAPVATAVKAPLSPRRKLVYAFVTLLVILGGAAWWWFHRPAPAYQVQDPGIYPFTGLSADGKTVEWGFIDGDGKVLIQPKWDQVSFSMIHDHMVAFNEGFCGVKQGDKWGFIDKSGNLAIPAQFDQVSPFVEGMAAVALGGQWGFIDKTGQYAVNPQFQAAGQFHDGLAAVESNGAWGFINKAGVLVIPAKFGQANSNGFAEGLAGVQSNGKVGYIDRSGKLAISTNFQSIDDFSEGLARVCLANKWGYINTSGKIVINPQFDSAEDFSNGRAIVRIGYGTGTIDKNGKFVLNPGQNNVIAYQDDALFVAADNGIGLMNTKGEWILKPSPAVHALSASPEPLFNLQLGADRGVLVNRSGKVLTGWYKGAMLDSLAQDLNNETSAIQSTRNLISAEASYSGAYPAKGFTASLSALGPATGSPDENHAGLIAADLATGTKDDYLFAVTIPEGTSTGGANFNYLLVAKPAAGHAGRSFCADSSGTVHYAVPGEECTTTSPAL
jgi:hypothetical protein